MNDPPSAAFSREEHAQRLQRARDSLRDLCDVCISVAPETHFHLAGYDAWVGVNSQQALVFDCDGETEPALLVRDVDVPLAKETSWLSNVLDYNTVRDDFAALVARLVSEIDPSPRRIGIEAGSYVLNGAAFANLRQAFPSHIEFVDLTHALGRLREIKSPAELHYLREAAEIAQSGLHAVRENLRPGISEIELAGMIEAAMRAAGGDYWSIPTELASGWRTPGGHATPRRKTVERGDLCHVEFAGVSRRYHAVACHTMACGSPHARAAEVYAVARQSLAAGLAAISPGVAVAEVEEASLGPVRAAGLEAFANMRFGYGIGIAYPPIWLETLQISRGCDSILRDGMSFVLHASLQLDDEHLGVIQGGTWLLDQGELVQLAGGGDVPLDVIAQ